MNTSTQLARAPQQSAPAALAVYNRSASEARGITEVLQRAAREAHLVSPATSCGELGEGMSVAFSTVLVDLERDTYAVAGGNGDDGGGGGRLGVGKAALERISMALGLSWDPVLTGRLDDGRDQNFVHYRAVGAFRDFSGTPIIVTGEKIIDFRDGSPAVTALFDRYRAKLDRWEKSGKRGYPPKHPTGQLHEQRLHALSMAATKARLRAIRSLGIRTSYTAAELAKPFVCARVAFTGATDDPALRRDFALMKARAALLGPHALRGDTPTPVAVQPPRLPAPPIATTRPDDGDFEEPTAPPVAAQQPPAGATADQGEPQAPPQANAPPPSAQSGPGGVPDAEIEPDEPARSGHVIPGGRNRGVALEEAGDEDIRYWLDRIAKSLADGSGRAEFKERDQQLVAAMRAELAKRDRDR